jgi:hypothetical protein
MNMLTSFAPFIVVAILIHLGLMKSALWAGAAIAAGLILRDRLLLGRSVRILKVGTAVLFVGLALYTAITAQAWTIPLGRLVVDVGLLAIVLLSLAIGLPFTLRYARTRPRQSGLRRNLTRPTAASPPYRQAPLPCWRRPTRSWPSCRRYRTASACC